MKSTLANANLLDDSVANSSSLKSQRLNKTAEIASNPNRTTMNKKQVNTPPPQNEAVNQTSEENIDYSQNSYAYNPSYNPNVNPVVERVADIKGQQGQEQEEEEEEEDDFNVKTTTASSPKPNLYAKAPQSSPSVNRSTQKESPRTNNTSEKKIFGMKPAVAIGVGVLLLGAAIAGVMIYNNSKKGKLKTKSTTPPSDGALGSVANTATNEAVKEVANIVAGAGANVAENAASVVSVVAP